MIRGKKLNPEELRLSAIDEQYAHAMHLMRLAAETGSSEVKRLAELTLDRYFERIAGG